MNSKQQKFNNFIMERVGDEHKGEVQQLLSESFQRQNNGTMDAQYLMQVGGKVMGMVKEEFKEEVQDIMSKFKD